MLLIVIILTDYSSITLLFKNLKLTHLPDQETR